ncbi:hypothetical protein GCM10008941_01930 [Rhizomicrobium palustre]
MDTGSIPDAVAKAVEHAGGAEHVPANEAERDFKARLPSLSFRDVTVLGHKISVTATDQNYGFFPGIKTAACSVWSQTNEDNSVLAFLKLVGAPSELLGKSPLDTLYKFAYRQDANTRTAVAEHSQAYLDAARHGQLWELAIVRDQNGASITLAHLYAIQLPQPVKTKPSKKRAR